MKHAFIGEVRTLMTPFLVCVCIQIQGFSPPINYCFINIGDIWKSLPTNPLYIHELYITIYRGGVLRQRYVFL